MPTAAAMAAVVALLMLPLALELGVAAADRPLLSGDAPYVLQQPRGLAWGGRDFTSTRAFESFLTARGANYETWAKRHPGAAPLARGPRGRDLVAAAVAGSLLTFLVLFGVPGRRRRSMRLGYVVAAVAGLAIATAAAWALLA